MPLQLPGSAVRVLPCCDAPVIVGAAVFVGGAAEAAATVAVAADVAELEPAEFEAVTATRSVEPTSAETAV